jgi:glycosyltransferase involved in cell wall biosynthesis
VRVLVDVSAVPARPVGAGVYTVALVAALDRRSDVDLHLAARRDDEARWHTIAAGAQVHATVPRRRPVRLVWEQTRATALASHVRPNVWHGPHYTMPLRAALPCVVTVHDMTFFDHPEWHERSKVIYFRRMIRAAARRAKVVVCVSGYTADRFRALTNPVAEVLVAHHGVDHDRFGTTADEAADRALLAPHGIEPPYIGFASTIEPRKNVPTLVRAFAQVAATHPELRLVLAGADGWGARDAREAIAGSGVATRVLRPGYLSGDTIAALFRRAAVVAYPSFEEGFGLPALEGLACGAAVVTTAGSALGEVVGDAALLAPPDDPSGLADAISRVLDDAGLSARLRAAGPTRAAQFTWERCAEQHLEAYAHAAAAGARA